MAILLEVAVSISPVIVAIAGIFSAVRGFEAWTRSTRLRRQIEFIREELEVVDETTPRYITLTQMKNGKLAEFISFQLIPSRYVIAKTANIGFVVVLAAVIGYQASATPITLDFSFESPAMGLVMFTFVGLSVVFVQLRVIFHARFERRRIRSYFRADTAFVPKSRHDLEGKLPSELSEFGILLLAFALISISFTGGAALFEFHNRDGGTLHIIAGGVVVTFGALMLRELTGLNNARKLEAKAKDPKNIRQFEIEQEILWGVRKPIDDPAPSKKSHHSRLHWRCRKKI